MGIVFKLLDSNNYSKSFLHKTFFTVVKILLFYGKRTPHSILYFNGLLKFLPVLHERISWNKEVKWYKRTFTWQIFPWQNVPINYLSIYPGGSYFAEHGNSHIFMAENGNTAYMLLDFRQKNNDGNGNIILEGRETEIINLIVMDVENHRS